MSKILGLDLGTNSIGWAVVDTSKEGNQIIDKGVRIFSEGVKIEKGKESSKAAERTKYRSARRIKFHRKLRKYETLKTLIKYGMCPLTIEELSKWRQEKVYPKSEDFINWQRTHGNKNPYYFRAKAVEQKIENPHELGRAFYHMAQRRGFLSNRLDTSQDNSDKSPVKSNINKLTELKGDITLGQYFYRLHKEAKKIRDNYTHREYHYLEEFNKICEIQQLKSEIRKELYKAIFFQRPLRSQKGLVGKCTFEKNKACCPVSHPLFEEFRMLSFINNIKYKKIEEDKFEILSQEQKEQIKSLFFRKSKAHFDFNDIIKSLTPKGEIYYFNYRPNVTVSGNPVSAYLKDIFGENWKNIKFSYIRENDGKLSEIDINDIWHVLFTYDSDEKLKEFARKRLKLNDDQIKTFLKIPIKQGYANLSLKAIKKIIPYLEEGLIFTYAAFLANIENIIGDENWKGNEKLIRDELKDIITNHNEEKQKEIIVNELIGHFKNNYNNAHSQYKLDIKDVEETEKKIIAHYGEKSWQKFELAKQNEIKEWILLNFEKQLQKVKDNFIKPKRIDEKFKDFLISNFNIDDKQLSKLYHPSDIEIYSPTKRNEKDGKLYLGSPMISAVKNPMAMRSLHQLRHLINALLNENIIDEETNIHIELTRDLNNANKRKAIQSWQRDRENKRKEYAEQIKKDYKAETGNDIEPTKYEILKYQLWEEQGHKCIYTGENIGISQFIGANPEFDIEHTIPRSQSYDNSQENLTLCNCQFNRKVKKNKIPFELTNHNEILARIEKWKNNYEEIENQIERAKRSSRVAQTKEAKDNAIQRKHKLTLERDYLRNKYHRFVTQEVPQGFKNSQLIDTGIITKYARAYLKTAFNKVYSVKGSAVAEFRKLWGLQEEYSKKERVNHIHHAIDAVTIACMNKERYDALAHYYHELEQYEKQKGGLKPHFEKPWETFTKYVKDISEDTFISHHTPDNVPKQSKKKLRKRGKIKYNNNGKTIYQQGDTVRGQLHKETVYGAIKVNREDEPKYVVRKNVADLLKNDIKNIVDKVVKEKIEEIIEQDGLSALKEEVWMNKEKDIRLKKVRCFTPSVSNPLHLKKHRDLSKHEYKQHINVVNDGNYLMAIYEGKDRKGKIKQDFKIVNLLEAGEYHKISNKSQKEIYPIVPEYKETGKKNKINIPLKACLKKGTIVLFFKNNPKEIWGLSDKEKYKILYKVTQFESDGRIQLRFHQEARPDTELIRKSDINFDIPNEKLRISLSKFNALIEGKDFILTTTGKIKRI